MRTSIGKALASFLSGKGAGLTGLISGGEGVKTGEALLSAEVRADGVVLFFAPLTFFLCFFVSFFLSFFFIHAA